MNRAAGITTTEALSAPKARRGRRPSPRETTSDAGNWWAKPERVDGYFRGYQLMARGL